MYISNNTIAVIFRVLFIIACGAGLVMKLIYTGFSLDVIMGDFALIVGVLSIIYFIYLIIARPDSENGILRGAVTIYMIVVFITYYFVHFGTSGNPLTNLNLAGFLLYFVAPIFAFLDYLLFCRKGEYTPYSPMFWTIIPILFNLAIFAINKFGWAISVIPYFNLLGLSLLITFFLFLGIGYLLFVVDNLMGGRGR